MNYIYAVAYNDFEAVIGLTKDPKKLPLFDEDLHLNDIYSVDYVVFEAGNDEQSEWLRDALLEDLGERGVRVEGNKARTDLDDVCMTMGYLSENAEDTPVEELF